MRVITLDENNKVVSVKNVGNNYVLGVNDIDTELGEIGQIMQPNGTFLDDTTLVTPQPVQPTNKELKDNQMTIMNGLTDIYMKQLGF